MLIRSSIAVLGMGLSLFAAPAAAQSTRQVAELGRLFFTPQQRRELDRRRQLNIQEATVVPVKELTVNGQVSRSSGKSTTWINNVPQHDAYPTRDPARVTLPGDEGEPPLSLKIGQTVDKVGGATRDVLGDGTIEIRGEGRPARGRERQP